jgi:hypothetical protein
VSHPIVCRRYFLGPQSLSACVLLDHATPGWHGRLLGNVFASRLAKVAFGQYVHCMTDNRGAVQVQSTVGACALSDDCCHVLAAAGRGFILRFESLPLEVFIYLIIGISHSHRSCQHLRLHLICQGVPW